MASSSRAAAIQTVLVVDDDRGVLSVVEDMLRTMGYRVIGTGDPLGALRYARMPGAIDLLLTDVVTPLMRGSQLAQEFRVIRPGVKVLFMSAYNVHQVEACRVKLAPGEPFLKKPFTIDELQSAVKAALVYRPPANWLRG